MTIFIAENIDTEVCFITTCTYNKENQIYTLIFTILNAYIYACKYADKNLIQFNAGTKLSITKKLKG